MRPEQCCWGNDVSGVCRAESQERSYRTEGNTIAPALTPADFIAMGRWHAYAYIQRAGVARQDVVELRHEY